LLWFGHSTLFVDINIAAVPAERLRRYYFGAYQQQSRARVLENVIMEPVHAETMLATYK
jgi:hypothetical protein